MKKNLNFLTVVLILFLHSSCKKEKFNERRLDGTWKLENLNGHINIISNFLNYSNYDYSISFEDSTFERIGLNNSNNLSSYLSNEISFDKKNNKVISTINRKSKHNYMRVYSPIFRDEACLDTIKDVFHRYDYAQTIIMEGEYTLMDKNEDYANRERMLIKYTRYGFIETITNEVNLQNNNIIENFYIMYYSGCITKDEYIKNRYIQDELTYTDIAEEKTEILEMKESTIDKMTFYTNSMNLITDTYFLLNKDKKEINVTFTYKKQ